MAPWIANASSTQDVSALSPLSPPLVPVLSWRDRSSSSSSPSPSPSPPSSYPQPSVLAWRSGVSPPFSNNYGNTRGASIKKELSYANIELGDILFLPRKVPLNSVARKHRIDTATEPWGHPVVVIDKYVENNEERVDIRVLTSFGGRRLEDHGAIHRLKLYMLVDNYQDNKPHDGFCLARMAEGSRKLRKRTYVNLQNDAQISIELKNLTPFEDRRMMRFDYASTTKIINGRSF